LLLPELREGGVHLKISPAPLSERGELKKLGRNYLLCFLCSFPNSFEGGVIKRLKA
jgi:hypothetical protein